MRIRFRWSKPVEALTIDRVIIGLAIPDAVIEPWDATYGFSQKGFYFEGEEWNSLHRMVAVWERIPRHFDSLPEVTVDDVPLAKFAANMNFCKRSLEDNVRDVLKLVGNRRVPKHEKIAEARRILRALV